MDILAYLQLYRWLVKGEWVYIRDNTMSFCYWCRPMWLRDNRWRGQYDVVKYEHW